MSSKEFKKYLIIIGTLLLLILGITIIFPPKKNFPSPESLLLIKKSSGPYSYKNTTNTFQTFFKDSPLKESSVTFKTAASQISFYTPEQQSFGNLNSSTSISKDNTVIYKNIFTDTDLKYTISSKRLLEEFIISTQPTALKFTQISQMAQTENVDGYDTNLDGSISFSYQNKLQFTLPKPVIYELSDQENKSYGIKYKITKTKTNSYQIDKVITPEGLEWLANLNRDYPIAIDLVIDTGDTAANWVSSDPAHTVVSQETTIKQEGTGSVKVVTTAANNITLDFMEYSSDTNAQTAYVTNSIIAAGGTETTSGVYRIHTFLASTTLAVTTGGNVEVLAVGGGGGGGPESGGGAGGLVYNSSLAISAGTTTVTVGNGGTSTTNGGNSVFYSITAYGGGHGVASQTNGIAGGCGGGAGHAEPTNSYTGGTGSQGYNGGNTSYDDNLMQNGYAGGGGGAGQAGGMSWSNTACGAGYGGKGLNYTISGVGVTYAGGGGGWSCAVGGAGGGGNYNSPGTNGLGGGGGGNGKSGGSGIVIARYPDLTLQSYSESTIITQGSYALKGVAKATNSLNKTLTRTIASPINLSGVSSLPFDLRSTRTGSNIKLGLHDSGGTTTEITPNITSANTFQSVTIDLSGVSNANKDAIDSIIITIVNADADNTFYLDNAGVISTSLNNTVTRSTLANIDFMEYSSDTLAQTAYLNNNVIATGGTETTSSGYRIHTFKGGTTLAVTNAGNVETLVVAGGGGGGNSGGGGGGAGGVILNTGFSLSVGTTSIIVGTGGAAHTNGNNSQFSTIIAIGGGRGGTYSGLGTGETGAAGGSGAGGSLTYPGPAFVGGSGVSGQGNNGGTGGVGMGPSAAGGGGKGTAGANGGSSGTGGTGGTGVDYSSYFGTSVGQNGYFGGGGGGGAWAASGGIGGSGGGGNGGGNVSTNGTAATANTGGGGGGGGYNGTGAAGGSGIVILRYLDLPIQSYSESTIKTEGSYALKGFAKITYSLNKTLTRTITSPINLTGMNSASFDLRSSRTGSNIKVGLHDSGGVTTEITPNITSANSFQTVSLDLSGVSNANKDAIDSIIITIVNADADNTFYLDNFGSNAVLVDASTISALSFWIRSNVTGQTLRFQFGETTSDEQTYNITIGATDTWEQKIWDISGISAGSRDAITQFAFKITDSTSAQTFYFDNIATNTPPAAPTLISPGIGATNVSLTPSLKTVTTDSDTDNLQYEVKICTDSGMSTGCQTFTAANTGWSGADVGTSSFSSGTTATYVLQAGSSLSQGNIYYWKSRAIDPAGSNTWSSTQTSPNNFTTIQVNMPASCLLEKNDANTSMIIKWLDQSANENGFTIQKKTDGAAYSDLISLSAGTTAYTDNSVSSGHTYQYQIASYLTGPIYSNWCETPLFNLSSPSPPATNSFLIY